MPFCDALQRTQLQGSPALGSLALQHAEFKMIWEPAG